MKLHKISIKKRIAPLLILIAIIVMIIQLTDSHEQPLEASSDSKMITATVTRVVDGDTMKVKLNDKHSSEETIRLLLVDTPETVHPDKEVQPFGPEASAFAKRILTNKEVQLEIDVSERDKYGRLLVYLWIDDQMFNQMLLEEGLARVAYVIPPNIKYIEPFRHIQQKSQKAARGIWSIENYALDNGFQDEAELINNNIEILSVTSPLKANQVASLKAKVPPGATASILVKYAGGASKAAGLEDKQADSKGNVSWDWKVSPNTKAGNWSITITSNGERITTNFVIQ